MLLIPARILTPILFRTDAQLMLMQSRRPNDTFANCFVQQAQARARFHEGGVFLARLIPV